MDANALTLKVLILSLFGPSEALLSAGERTLAVRARGDALSVEEAGVQRDDVQVLRVPERGEARAGVLVAIDHRGTRIRRRFPGAVVARARGGTLELMNEVPSEEYVARVLASEADEAAALPQAAQALAVVVRSFAFAARRAPRHPQAHADLCDSTHCQLYQGMERGGPWAIQAVRATSGRILSRAGVPVEAYFTAACGGRSAAIEDVWGGPARAHLVSLPCRPCERDPSSPWEKEIAAADLDRALRGEGLLPPGCRLASLGLVERGAGGWVRRVEARCAGGGAAVRLRGEALRVAIGRHLGWSLLPSANFSMTRAAALVRFAGRGRGHGVGLCLNGSARLAREGASANHILLGYFPGTMVTASHEGSAR